MVLDTSYTTRSTSLHESGTPAALPWWDQSYSTESLTLLLVDMSHVARLSHEEETALLARVQQGDQTATSRLIEVHLRLVIHVAKQYTGYLAATGGVLSLDDLIQEGTFGLARALDTFDPQQGAFSTYAVWWIHHAVQRALANQGRTIRLPVHVYTRLSKLAQMQDRMWAEQGCEPDEHALARALHWPLARVRLLLTCRERLVSLDMPATAHQDSPLRECLPDLATPVPDEQVCTDLDTHERARRIRAALACLTPRERQVIVSRFGLDDDMPQATGQTLAEIGRHLGVCRERVRQLERRALDKLAKRADLAALLTRS